MTLPTRTSLPKAAVAGGRRIASPKLIAASAVGLSLVANVIGWASGRRRKPAAERRSSPRLFTPRELARDTERNRRFVDLPGFALGPVRLDRATEAYHMLLLGDAGAGKRATVRSLLRQMRERGEAAIVCDPSGAFASEFYVEGVDTILDPRDARSAVWSPWVEVAGPSDCARLAGAFVPDQWPDDLNRFWIEAARTVLEALLHRFGPTGDAGSVARALRGSVEQLALVTHGTPAEKLLCPDVPGVAEALRTRLDVPARALELVAAPRPQATSFSAMAWCESPQGFVFLGAGPDPRAPERLLLSVLADCLLRPLFELARDKSAPVWFVADELESLDRIAALGELFTRGRVNRVAGVIGIGSAPRVDTRYGPWARDFVNMAPTKLFFRSSDPETAQWGSRLIGSGSAAEGSEQAPGADEGDDPRAAGRRDCPLVGPEEIRSLPDDAYYLMIAGKTARIGAS